MSEGGGKIQDVLRSSTLQVARAQSGRIFQVFSGWQAASRVAAMFTRADVARLALPRFANAWLGGYCSWGLRGNKGPVCSHGGYLMPLDGHSSASSAGSANSGVVHGRILQGRRCDWQLTGVVPSVPACIAC